MSWSQTFSGVAFTPLDPRPEDVRLEDIAHHLSLQCRFAGATRRFYSVAEHSVLVSRVVPQEGGLPLAALLHDAAEAYLVDIPTPIKRHLYSASDMGVESINMLEFRIQTAIADALGVETRFTDARIKAADLAVLMAEARKLMGPSPRPWDIDAEPADVTILGLDHGLAEELFLHRYGECRRLAGVE